MRITLLYLALAGGLGALARYGLAGLIQRDSMFPWGTFAVNALGCFLFGALWSAMEHRLSISTETRAIVLTGFLGAFTTFSTFMFETANLLRDSQWLAAIANVIGQNTLGLAAVILGMAVGRLL